MFYHPGLSSNLHFQRNLRFLREGNIFFIKPISYTIYVISMPSLKP